MSRQSEETVNHLEQDRRTGLYTSLLRHKKTYWAICKGIFAIALFYTLYCQIRDQENLDELFVSFSSCVSWSKAPFLLTVFVLMVFNWLIEAKKWSCLLKDKSPSLMRCFEGIWMGQSFGIMTPGNLGDYGGRQLVLPREELNSGLTATLIASLAQNTINIVFGLFGMLYIIQIKGLLARPIFIGACLLGFILIMFVIIVYRALPKISSLKKWIKNKSFKARYVQQTTRIKEYSKEELDILLALSFIRYLVYSIQYILILYFFGVTLSIWILLAGVALIFLVQTGLPLPPVLGVLARGEVALILWTSFGAAAIPILAATFSLWLINKVVPAICGMFLMMGVKLK